MLFNLFLEGFKFSLFLGGASGLYQGFHAIGLGTGGLIFVGVLMIIIGVGFGLAALADFYMLAKVRILLLLLLKKGSGKTWTFLYTDRNAVFDLPT